MQEPEPQPQPKSEKAKMPPPTTRMVATEFAAGAEVINGMPCVAAKFNSSIYACIVLLPYKIGPQIGAAIVQTSREIKEAAESAVILPNGDGPSPEQLAEMQRQMKGQG